MTSWKFFRPSSVKRNVTIGSPRRRVALLARVLDLGAAQLGVVPHDEVALEGRVAWKVLRTLRLQHHRARRDLEHLEALRHPAVVLGQQLLARGVRPRGQRLVRPEQVELPLRRVVVVYLRRALRGALDRRVEAVDRRGGATDDVALPVVEVELRGRADLGLGALQVLHAGQADRDLVVAEPLDLGLRDAQAVHALPHDVDRAVDRLGRDLALRGRLALVHQLDAALQVETELGLLRDDDRHRADHEAEHQQDHEQISPPRAHLSIPAAILDPVSAGLDGSKSAHGFGVSTSRRPPSSS